ncbi:tape measure protein [Pedobacter lithocola]|uniref:Tape measure protein n=1 Tax=Pedobacter lithocola TaxID=1908239 RepID=A0ABV8PEF4_9SPHI
MAKRASGSSSLNWSVKVSVDEARKNIKTIRQEFDEMIKKAQLASKALTSGFDAKPMTGYQQGLLNLKSALATSQENTERLRQENIRLRNEYEQGKISAQSYRTEIAKINLERKQEVEAARAARKAAQEVAGSYNEAQKRLKELGTEIKGAENGFKKLTPELRAKVKEYNELNEALKKFDEKMGNHQRNVGNYRGAIRGASEDLLSFATTYLSLGNALTYVFDKTLAFQRIKTPLTYILGSEGEANNKLAELKQLAADLGLEFFTIANSYKQFTAAARASNFDLAQSEKIFKSVTKASAVLGLSNEQLEGSLLAIQQMISKGNVQAEELRGQLSERLPGAFALSAKAMGVTEQELNKLLKTGDVVASDLLPKLALELDKSYGDKAAAGVAGLNAELGRLTTELSSAAGDSSALSKKLFEPIIIGAREAVKEIGQMFRGSFAENLRYFFTFSNKSLANQRSVYDLRDAKNNNLSAQKAAEQYSTEGKSLADLRTKYQQLGESVKNAVEAQAKFKADVKSGAKEETKDATVIEYTAIANGIIAQRRRIGEAYAILKQQQKSAIKEVRDESLTAVADIRKRITELQKMSGSAIEGSDVSDRIKALQDKLKKPSNKKVIAEDDSAFKAQRALQAKLDEAGAKGKRESLDADEKELADKKAFYENLRRLAREHNEDVEKYNASPKNSGKKRRIKVDAGVLLPGESDAIGGITDKIAANELKNSLDDQKKIYEDFEQFRITFGEEKAKERFKNAKDRYGNLIDLDRTYLEKLNDLQSKLTGDDKAKGGDGGGQQIAKQAKVLEDATRVAVDEENKKNLELLKAYQSYADKRKGYQEAALAEAARLRKLGDEAAAQNAINEGIEQVKQLDSENIKKMASYKVLFDWVGKRTKKQLYEAIKAYEEDLKNFKGNAQEKAKAQKELDNLKQAIKTNNIQELQEVVSQLSQVATIFDNINGNIGNISEVLINAAQAYVDIQKGIKDIKDPEKSTTEKIGAGLGIVGAAISVANSVFGYFKGLKAAKEAAKKAMDEYQDAAIKGERDYQALLRKRQLDDAQRGKTSYNAIISQLEALKKQSPEIEKAYNKIFSALQGESYTSGVGYQNGTWLRKAKTWDIMASLAGSQFADLEKLYTQGKLKDQAKADFESLKALRDELELAGISVQQLQEQLNDLLTGTNVNGLADGLKQLFENGKFAAQDFATSFEDIMRKSLSTSFSEKVMKDALKPFYDEYAALFVSGTPTNSQIDALREKYKQIGSNLGQQYQEMIDAAGLNSNVTPPSGVIGTITSAGLTENSANQLLGIARGTFDNTKITAVNSLKIATDLGKIYLSALNSFQELQAINANTFRTAKNTDNVEALLINIDKNTKPSPNSGYQNLINNGVKP